MEVANCANRAIKNMIKITGYYRYLNHWDIDKRKMDI